MLKSRCALVVAATPALRTEVCAWLTLAGWNVALATAYPAAKRHLSRGVDLLVTELELGDYNGLQLALRSQAARIPTVVIGRHDPVLEREAEQLECSYIRKDELDSHRLTVAIEGQVAARQFALPAISRNVEFERRPWASSSRVLPAGRRLLLH